MKTIYLLIVSIFIGFIALAMPFKIKIDLKGLTIVNEKPIEKKKPEQPPKKKLQVTQPENYVVVRDKQAENLSALLVPTITATKSVVVNGGGNPVPGSVLDYSIVLNNAGTDATGVTLTDILSSDLTLVAGSVKATPIAMNDSYDCIGNVGITVPAASGVLTNDVNPVNTSLQATAVNTAGTQGTVSMAPDGSFTFTPTTGFSGTTTFSYTISNTQFTSNATVTITVSAPIWFVNIGASSNGTGTLASPFRDWSDFATSNALSGSTNPAANQTIFVYSGTYSGAATLKSGQKVLGKGATISLASFAGVTVPTFSNPLPTTSGASPNLTSSSITISLSTNNTLRGFDMGSSTRDISGSSFGTLTTSEMALNGTGDALFLTSGTLATNFTSISSVGTLNSIFISSCSGTFSGGNTNLSGGSGSNLVLGNNTASFTFGSLDIAASNSQNAIDITNHSNGTITCTSGTITESNGVAVNITGLSSASRAPLSMVLTSVSKTGLSSINGIVLSNTSGSFTINGTGATAGSGGTISSVTDRGFSAINASNITLKNMNFINANTAAVACTSPATDNTGCNAGIHLQSVSGVTLDNIQMNTSLGQANAVYGINMNGVSNFILRNSTISRCGTDNEEACLYALNTTGTCIIENSTLSKAARIARFTNSVSTPLTLKVTGSSFNDTRTLHDNTTLNANGQSGILFEGLSSAVMSLDVKSSCNFLRCASQGVNVVANNTSTVNADVQNSTIDATNAALPAGEDVGLGVLMEAGDAAVIKFNIKNNIVKGRAGNLIGLGTVGVGNARMEGTVEGNAVTYNFVNSVSNNSGYGIVYNHLSSNTDSKVKIHNNTLTNFQADGTIGISSLIQGGKAHLIITNNNITFQPVANTISSYGIRSSVTVAGASGCTRMANNQINITSNANTTTSGYAQLRASIAGTTFDIEGSGNIANPELSIWNANANTPSIVTNTQPTFISSGGAGTRTLVASGTCLAPTNTLLNLRIAAPEIAENKIENNENTVLATKPDSTVVSLLNESETVEAQEVNEELSTKNIDIQENANARMLSPQAGETVTINGSGSGFTLPAGKSTTITFSATVSATPSTCAITNQASVSGSNFSTVNSNTTTTNLIVAPPTGVTGATSICNGQSVSLTATCSGTVQWYNAAATATLIGTGSPLVQSPIAPTTYQAACLIGGCASTRTNSGLITVNALPVPNPTSNTPVCSSKTLNLSSSSSTSYVWTGPNSFSSSTQNPTITNVTTAAAGTYTITQTNSFGCTASATTAVVINQSPTASASGNSPICSGNSLNLSSSGGGTYFWSGPNSFTSSVQNPTINNVTTAANGTYTITVTSSGCTATATTAVTVNTTPATPSPSSNSPVCVGNSLNLNSPTVAGATYSWTGPNSYSSGQQSPQITNVSTAAGGVYTLSITTSGCSASNTTNVVINSTTAIASSNSPVNVTGTLNLSSTGGGTYVWAGPNSFTSTSQNPSITGVTTAFAGTYTVTVTNTGCTATATTAVVVNEATASNNSPICNGSTLNLSSGGGVSYLWAGPNSFSSTVQNPSFTNAAANLSGTYTVTVTASGGGSATATTAVTVSETPTVNAISNQELCNNAMTSAINFSGAVSGATYTWTNSNTSIGLGANGTGNIASFMVTNTTAVPVTSTITVTPSFSYPGTPVSGSQTFNYTGALQTFTVPAGVTSLTIEARGAQGGNVSTTCAATGGLGASMKGDFAVTPGEVLTILVGGQGQTNGADAGGGGGTYIVRGTNTALLVAGGGGGATNNIAQCGSNRNGVNATITTSGTASANGLVAGGTSGNGGGASAGSGGGGGGFLTDGTAGTGLANNNGKSFLNGGIGGTGNNNDGGGFGGGGAGWFTGGNGGGGGGYSGGGTSGSQPFSGGGGGGSYNNGTNQINTAGVGTGNGIVLISYTDPGTLVCTGTPQTFTITVNPSPTVTASSNSPICAATTLNLSSTTGVSYTWSGSNSFSSTVQNPTISNVTTAAQGTYSVTITDSNGCTASATTSVTVNSLPTPNPTTNSPVCVGNTLNLSSAASTSYLWSGPNSFSSSLQNPSISNATAAASGTYTITQTNSFGCTVSATTAVMITSLASPTDVLVNTTIVCNGSSVILSASCGNLMMPVIPKPQSNGQTGALSSNALLNASFANSSSVMWYTSSTGGLSIGSGSPFNHIPTGTTTYYAACTDGTCESSRVATNQVTIEPVPAAPTGTSSQTVCSSSIASLSAYCTTGTIRWYNSGGSTVLFTGSPFITPSITANTTYKVRCETALCQSPFVYVDVFIYTNLESGTGLDGAYSATSNTTLAGGTYNFTSFNINSGVVVTVTGTQPLIINATGLVTINGTLLLKGGNGSNGVTFSNAGAGGIAVAGGSNGGAGTYSSSVGPLNGVDGFGQGGLINKGSGWSGGGGAGYAFTGLSSGGVGGTGGASYGTANITGFDAGSGGGGGSGGYSCGAGGGGAGGGFVHIISGTSIIVGASGIINANGGDGGTDGTGNCGGGGGGSGGSIWLTSPTISQSGLLTAIGGIGGSSTVPGTPYFGAGAGGSVGRIRMDYDGILGGSGTFQPAVGSTNSLPISIPTASNNSPICANNTLNLSSSSGSSYNWVGPNSFSSTLQNPTISGATTNASGTYTVTITDGNGCTNTATTVVTINALPIPNPTSNSPKCEGTTLTFNSVAGMTTYAWSGPNSFSSSTQTPSISNVTTAANGTYTLTVTNASGCSASATTGVIINANPVPNPTSNSPVCAGSSLNLSSVASMSVYNWSGPNSFSSSVQNPTISGVSPAGNGTYTVTVTDANGCSATSTISVTVYPAPATNIASNSPVCEGGTLNLSSATSLRNTWSGPNSFSSSAMNPTISNATTAASGVYTVTKENDFGCTATATINVVVNPKPTPTIGSNTPVCSGLTLNLTADGGTAYAWNGPNSFSSTQQNPTISNVSTAATGTYTVSVTNVNGCSTTATTSVTINASPTPTATNNSPLCAGSTLNLSASSASTYSWSGPNSFNSSLQNPNISNVTVAANGTYTLTVTDGNGCIGSTTTVVTVNPLPTPTASSNSPVCVANTLNLSSSGGTSYLWAGPNSFTSNSQNPTISNVTTLSQGTYSVTVSDGKCSAMATTAVTINTLPAVSATNNSPICVGNTINLSSTAGMASYAWSGPNSFISSSQNPTVASATISNTGTYTVTVTNSFGCLATATTSVVVNPLPTPVAGSNSPICEGSTLNLTGNSATTYSWSGPNSFSSSSQNPSITGAGVLANGIYSVVHTNSFGCSASATTQVTVNPNPVVGTTASTSAICVGNSVSLSATCTNYTVVANLTGGQQVPSVTTNGTGTSIGTYNSITNQLTLATSFANLGTNATMAHIHSGATGVNGGVLVMFSGVPSATSGNFGYSGNISSFASDLLAGNTYINIHTTANSGGEIRGQLSAVCTSNNYVWSPGNISGQNITVSPTTTTVYTVTASNLSTGCSATATTQIIVNALPMPSVGSNSPLCSGLTLNLTASGGSTYAWTGPNSFASTAQNPNIPNATTSNSGVYSVTITNINGCTATATTSVTVFNLPNPNIGSNSPLCEGATLNLSAENGGTSYVWSGPNSFNSTLQNPTIGTTTLANAGVYSITITNSSGCTATATTLVVINPLNVSATNTGPYTTNQTIQLVGSGGNIYSWTGPNGFTATGAIVNRTNATLNMAGVYTATITNGPCSNTATTNVVVTGIDPCVQLLEYTYVQAGNPYQPLFSLSNGMNIAQSPNPTSVIVHPICSTVTIESVEMNLQGPEGMNWNILQNVEPFALFDNAGLNVFGRTLVPGNYTLTVTGYSQDNKGGVVTYPKTEVRFTITGNLATVGMPTYSGTEFCAGSTVPVSFTTTGTFNSGNIFKVQLSDGNGDFTTPIEIGSSTTAGSINCLIPLSIPFGENYRMRVISTDATSQNMNPSAIVVHPYIANLVTPTDDLSSDKTRKAVYQLNATNKVNSPAKVNYRAGNSIQLNAGFEAKAGTVFEAKIAGCN